MAYNPDNIFNKILNKKLPAAVIFETDHSLAIMDAFPCIEGHALLIPKIEAALLEEMADASPEILAGVMKDLAKLSRAIRRTFSADATSIQVNNGRAAGQLVPHLHFHVIPRMTGDRLITLPKSASLMLSTDIGESVAKRIREHLM